MGEMQEIAPSALWNTATRVQYDSYFLFFLLMIGDKGERWWGVFIMIASHCDDRVFPNFTFYLLSHSFIHVSILFHGSYWLLRAHLSCTISVATCSLSPIPASKRKPWQATQKLRWQQSETESRFIFHAHKIVASHCIHENVGTVFLDYKLSHFNHFCLSGC